MIVLHRVDPERNLYRWYSVHVQPTLLDPWAVVCAWGSLKSDYRRQRAIPCESKEDAGRLAAKIVARKEAKGYERKDSPEKIAIRLTLPATCCKLTTTSWLGCPPHPGRLVIYLDKRH